LKQIIGIFLIYVLLYIQHGFLCRSLDSTVSEDAGIEPSPVTTLASTARRSNHSAKNLIHQNTLVIFLLSLDPHLLKKSGFFILASSILLTYFCGYVVPSAVTSCCPLLQNQETQEKSSPQSHHRGTPALSPPRIPAFLGLTILKFIYKKYSASWSHSSISFLLIMA
jgi:hypothetical protein